MEHLDFEDHFRPHVGQKYFLGREVPGIVLSPVMPSVGKTGYPFWYRGRSVAVLTFLLTIFITVGKR